MIQTINIPTDSRYVLKLGDTIPEILFNFEVTDAIDLTGATIRMQLYLNGKKKLDLDSTAGITIVDSKNFKIDEIPYEENHLPYGKLKGDLEITLADGKRVTYADVSYTITKHYTV